MYPEYMVSPMREELTKEGFVSLTTPEEVEKTVQQPGTTFVVINSVCGCAAANARPAAVAAVKNGVMPNRIATVFAGVDILAVDKIREMMLPYPPSSPAMALFKDGKLVHIIERHLIEGRPAQMIADNLIAAFNQHCK